MDRLTLCLLTAVHLTASNVLLPGDVMPLHYDVRLTYDIDPATNYSFFGVVSILITLKQSTSEIIMHAENFTISEDAITLRGAGNPRVTSVRYDDIHNFLILGVDTPLLVGQNFTLTIPFRGNLKVGNTGAYICPYHNTFFNRSEYLITTQLEGVHPRKWFPCFDELTYKATFAFTIGHYKDYTAVSNMPIRNTSPLNALEEYWPWTVIEASFRKSITGFLWDQFETTPPVATYLLWLTVSILSYKETYAEPSHIKFRIWSQKGVKDQTSLALSVGPALLTHYQSWFNMPMPVHAYEMFAIPDCDVGLVEAWGLLSHREEVLLYNEKKPNNSIKAWTIFFIAHGLVHQWLNLVTMKWWTDVWLYEALCMYLAMTVGETIMEPPTWQRDAIASDSVTELLPLDTGKTSHPMAVTLHDPKNYSQIYDRLVYYKSTALIRMMAMVVGTNCFREAIRRFITNHMYSTADHDDFWQELTEIGRNCGGTPRNVTVQQIMGTWTSQAGFPLLTVTRNYTDQTLTLRQKHYQLPGANASDSAWWIPLRVLSESKDKEPVTYNEWLTNVQGIDEEHKFALRTDNDKWILFNYDVIAPYRINYDRSNWLLLADTLTSDRFTSIPEANRIQLLSDAFNLAAHGRLDYGTVLQLVSYVRRETQYVPFRMAFDSLLPLYTRLKSTSHFHVFQKFVMRLLIKQYWQSGGLTKRSYDEKELYGAEMQELTCTWACRLSIFGCDKTALELFQRWMATKDPDENNPIQLSNDLHLTAYCAAISRGGAEHWHFLKARLRRAKEDIREILLKALCCSRDVWILVHYMETSIMNGTDVTLQDADTVFSSILTTSSGFPVAKEFIYNKIENIHTALYAQESLGNIVTSLLAQFYKKQQLDEFLVWQDTNAKYLTNYTKDITDSIELAKKKIEWVDRHQTVIFEKLQELTDYEDLYGS